MTPPEKGPIASHRGQESEKRENVKAVFNCFTSMKNHISTIQSLLVVMVKDRVALLLYSSALKIMRLFASTAP
jgi:hypothetical protein